MSPPRRPSRPEPTWLARYRDLFKGWSRRQSSSHDAEDALHDAALALLSRDNSAVQDPAAYFYRSAQHKLYAQARAQKSHASLSLSDLAQDEHPFLDDSQSNARTLQLSRALEAALAQLPLKCRQAYVWHRLEGYSQREIAERLGVSLNSVERYIMRALQHVSEQLHAYRGDE